MEPNEVVKKFEDMVESLSYPIKPQKPEKSAYKNNMDFGEALDLWEVEKEKWLKLVEEYRSANNRVNLWFKKELLESLGIAENPKADILYEMAWERGHSNGYYEVAIAAEDLMRLL